MAIRLKRAVCAPWPSYRIAWRRPSRRGSDDWTPVMLVDAGRPGTIPPGPRDGVRVYDPFAPLVLMMSASAFVFCAVYGAVSIVLDLLGR